MISTSDNINRSIDVIAVNTGKKKPQYFEKTYAIYIIMAKNGMSSLRVLIQPYPLPSLFPFGRGALLVHVTCGWRFLHVLSFVRAVQCCLDSSIGLTHRVQEHCRLPSCPRHGGGTREDGNEGRHRAQPKTASPRTAEYLWHFIFPSSHWWGMKEGDATQSSLWDSLSALHRAKVSAGKSNAVRLNQ